MTSAILACERTTHPVLLHCLQNLDHDWRRLQLVNSAMCSAFRLHKHQVATHTVRREQLDHECVTLCADIAALRNPHLSPTLTQLWSSLFEENIL
jgi:hypothetical protein